MKWFRIWDEAYRAWYRGERRIAPAGMRGRVYERKPGGGPIAAVTKLKATMKLRVYRAATGKWEDV